MCKTATTIACKMSKSSIYPKALNTARVRLESSIYGETESIDVHSEIVPLNCNAKSYHTGTHTDTVNDNCESINIAWGGVLGRRSRSLSGGNSGMRIKSNSFNGKRKEESNITIKIVSPLILTNSETNMAASLI